MATKASEEKLSDAQAQLSRLVQRQRDFLSQLSARIASLGSMSTSPMQAEELQAQIVLSLFAYVDELETLLPLAAIVAASLGESDLVRARVHFCFHVLNTCTASKQEGLLTGVHYSKSV